MSDSTHLSDIVHRNPYFQRSVNIGYDHDDGDILESFYCPLSYQQVIVKMVHHLTQSQQGAFTWTGAYGSGKSSLALFLQALVDDNPAFANAARAKLSDTYRTTICDYFNPETHNWHIINIVGQRQAASQLFSDALALDLEATTQTIVAELTRRIEDGERLIIFMDELGKVLDDISHTGDAGDIYFLQQLAEFANRSQGKVIVIGLLHQSFMAYARQANRKMQQDWLKIQGRFIDCAIDLSIDEQIHLIGQVIHVEDDAFVTAHHAHMHAQVEAVISNMATQRKLDKAYMGALLHHVFPLHPLVAVLLCQLSQKNFGQRQRSVFSFLMSAEPNGFGDYLTHTSLTDAHLFSPEHLWDYLNDNLQGAIATSEHSKAWLLSQPAVAKYEAQDDSLAIRIIKLVTLVSIFADNSGVHASYPFLQQVLGVPTEALDACIADLEAASVIVYRKFNQAYTLREGSDFNLHDAVSQELATLDRVYPNRLTPFQPILAHAHYHRTGSWRAMHVRILTVDAHTLVRLNALQQDASASTAGYLCLLAVEDTEQIEQAQMVCAQVEADPSLSSIVVAVFEGYSELQALLNEERALVRIVEHDTRLTNDAIARKEVALRQREIENQRMHLLDATLTHVQWYGAAIVGAKQRNHFQLSTLASQLADARFSQAFLCANELVNRNAPSPSARGGIRELLRRMIEHSDEPNLGMEKYPPERAIYDAVLHKTGLHRCDDEGNYGFTIPRHGALAAIWQCADAVITARAGELVSAQDIYDAWHAPPYGIKAGLHEILYIAYIASRHHDLANYIDEAYKPQLEYILAEYLIKVPAQVGVREVSRLQREAPWIYGLRDGLESAFPSRVMQPIENSPLSIAQALIRVFDGMHPWVMRSNHERLSPSTRALRNILKQANDPNKLLFDDLPRFFNANDDDAAKVAKVLASLQELDALYPALVTDINALLYEGIKVAESVNNPYIEINQRAQALFGRSGDYLLDAFITRLITYDGSMNDAEGLISLLAGNKPASKWIDRDIIKAQQQVSAFCFQFLEAEVNASVHASPNRQKVGVVTKSPKTTESIVQEAHITDANAGYVQKQAKAVSASLQASFSKNDHIAIIAKMIEYVAGLES